MQHAQRARTPAHLWIVGILSLLWNGFGCYDYLMTRLHNLDYLAATMPGVEPAAAIAWVENMPMSAQIGWGLGVWGGLLGALLLVMRSRYAVWAFAASMVGIVLTMSYQLLNAPPPPGAVGPTTSIMPYLIIAVGAALLAYAYAMQRKGVLR